jgi:outer membrane protein
MTRPLAFLGLLAPAFAAGCRGVEELDRWRYEKILYEEDPKVESRQAAASRFESLSAKPELTLEECYRLALYRSESLALSGEDLVRVRTQYEQIRGTVLPAISFHGSWTRQDRTVATDDVRQSFTLHDRTQYQFAVHQPVFSGLAEIYALRQRGALTAAREHDLRHARLLLFADAADAFYAVLQLERDVATTEDSHRLATERLEELVQRNRAGISRRSEVLAQEAELASLQAALERLRGALAVAWEALGFVTGLAGPRKLFDTLPEPGELPALAELVARAHARRSDLQAAAEAVRAAEEGVGIARAGYLPAVSLDANYFTHREGVSEGIDWDAALSFEIPIFEGGVTQARLREARSHVRSAGLALSRLRREVQLEVSRAWTAVRTLLSELGSLEKAVASAQENYDIVQAEYRGGIVTNIEVLASFNTLQRARLARDRARFHAKLASVRLSVQTGALPGGAP